jgi:hypothetical protein
MMDGQVAAIRDALDGAGFEPVGIIAYAAKFASAFYGPFREAAECAPRFGDRTGYQMDPPNSDEAIREVRSDIDEGADIVMVKPALPYLDIIRRAKEETRFPMAAYNVSGEYAMLKAASLNGWLDERAVLEALRHPPAGADLVLTYREDAAAGCRAGLERRVDQRPDATQPRASTSRSTGRARTARPPPSTGACTCSSMPTVVPATRRSSSPRSRRPGSRARSTRT